MTMIKVLVSGASGFVGEALVLKLLVDGIFAPVAAVRRPARVEGLCPVRAFDLSDCNCLPDLSDIAVVIHAAARVHVMNETATDALSEFRKLNVEGTLALARRAAESGVKRFIYISSIKVNGEFSTPGKPFSADDVPNPEDPYGVSKYEAEEALMKLGKEAAMEIVIIRPPLVYGPGVKANFLQMLALLDKKIPLPLGGLGNKRSMVALPNLVDFIITCIDHPAAANQIFLVSDGEDLSVSELLTRLCAALGVPSYLFYVPRWMLMRGAYLVGRQALARRYTKKSRLIGLGSSR
jgi:nucleoside-diphosphate-sugar epimerase